jgi:hypothetical protein
MGDLDLGCRVLLGVVFAVAAVGKLRSATALRAFADSLLDLGWLPDVLRWPAAVATPLAEGGAVALLAVPATAGFGYALVLLLLAALTLGAVVAIRRGRGVRCQCFGSGEGELGKGTVMRNLLLMAVAIAGSAVRLGAGDLRLSAAGAELAGVLGALAALAVVRWAEFAFLLGVGESGRAA